MGESETFKAMKKVTLLWVVIIIIFILAIMFLYVSWLSSLDQEEETPIPTIIASKDLEGNYSLYVSHIDPSVKLSDVTVTILDEDSIPVFKKQLDLIAEGTNSSIIRFENNGSTSENHLDQGDIIVVVTVENGGYAEPGFLVRFTYDPTGMCLAIVWLP